VRLVPFINDRHLLQTMNQHSYCLNLSALFETDSTAKQVDATKLPRKRTTQKYLEKRSGERNLVSGASQNLKYPNELVAVFHL